MVLSQTCLVNIPLVSDTGRAKHSLGTAHRAAAADTITWCLPPLHRNPRLNSGIVPPITKQLKESHCQVPSKLGKGLAEFNPLGSLEPATRYPPS